MGFRRTVLQAVQVRRRVIFFVVFACGSKHKGAATRVRRRLVASHLPTSQGTAAACLSARTPARGPRRSDSDARPTRSKRRAAPCAPPSVKKSSASLPCPARPPPRSLHPMQRAAATVWLRTFLWKTGLVCPPNPDCLLSYRRFPAHARASGPDELAAHAAGSPQAAGCLQTAAPAEPGALYRHHTATEHPAAAPLARRCALGWAAHPAPQARPCRPCTGSP